MADDNRQVNIGQVDLGVPITHLEARQVFQAVFHSYPANRISLLLHRILKAYRGVNNPLCFFIRFNNATELHIEVRPFNGLGQVERNFIVRRIKVPIDRTAHRYQHIACIAKRRSVGDNGEMPFHERQLVLRIHIGVFRNHRLPEAGRNNGRILLNNQVQVSLPPRCYLANFDWDFMIVVEMEFIIPQHVQNGLNVH